MQCVQCTYCKHRHSNQSVPEQSSCRKTETGRLHLMLLVFFVLFILGNHNKTVKIRSNKYNCVFCVCLLITSTTRQKLGAQATFARMKKCSPRCQQGHKGEQGKKKRDNVLGQQDICTHLQQCTN